MNSLLCSKLVFFLAEIRTWVSFLDCFYSPGDHDESENRHHDTLGRQEEEEEDLMNSSALSSAFGSLSPERKRFSLAYFMSLKTPFPSFSGMVLA